MATPRRAYAGTSGRLRITRIRAHVQGYMDGTLLYKGDYNTNDASVKLTLQNNGTRDATAVTFDNCAFTALLSATNLPLTVADNAPVQWAGNGHWYQAVWVGASGISWPEAFAAATNAHGYLATITSADENTCAFDLVSDPALWVTDPYGNALGPWLGGPQPLGSSEPAGNWQWVTGEPMAYLNWATDQPDNDQGTEDRLQFFGAQATPRSQWNDTTASELLRGYLIEYLQFQVAPRLSITLNPQPSTIVVFWSALVGKPQSTSTRDIDHENP